MLTGDKGDTAHQIAFSCGLYSYEEDFKVFRIEDGKSADDVINKITGLKDEAKYGVTISATNLIGIMAAEESLIKGERAIKMLKII
jgi:magnesium-transporting ATPase (P-type)